MTASVPSPMGAAMHRRMLAAVHAQAKKNGLEDDAYRDMLQLVTGQRSAKQLTTHQLSDVLDHLNGKRDLGHRSFRKSNDPQVRKMYAQWNHLKGMGVLRDSGVGGLRAFCARQISKGASIDPEFLSAAEKRQVIEALKAWIEREEKARG